MDDDGLTREQIDILAALPVSVDRNGHRTVVVPSHLFDRLIATAAALESRSEVLEQAYNALNKFDDDVDMEDYESVAGWWTKRGGPALNAIRALKSPRAEPGAPSELGRDDDCVRRDFERGVIERAEHEPNAAEQASPSVAPAESNSEFAAGPASAAPERTRPDATQPDMTDYDRGLRDGRARGFAEGLEEAAKVCEQLWKNSPNDRASGFHQNLVSHGCVACVNSIRAKIKPTRGDT